MAHASINRNNILKQLVVSENSIKSNSTNPSPKLVGNGQVFNKTNFNFKTTFSA
jgi:hypothetical protein